MSISTENEFTVSLTVQFDPSFSQRVKDDLKKEMLEKIRTAQSDIHKFMIEDEVVVRTATRFKIEQDDTLDSTSSMQVSTVSS